MDKIEGGYVGQSACPGDLIHLHGVICRVVGDLPHGVRLVNNLEGGGEYTLTYQLLRQAKAYFVARLISCHPPVEPSAQPAPSVMRPLDVHSNERVEIQHPRQLNWRYKDANRDWWQFNAVESVRINNPQGEADYYCHVWRFTVLREALGGGYHEQFSTDWNGQYDEPPGIDDILQEWSHSVVCVTIGAAKYAHEETNRDTQ